MSAGWMKLGIPLALLAGGCGGGETTEAPTQDVAEEAVEGADAEAREDGAPATDAEGAADGEDAVMADSSSEDVADPDVEPSDAEEEVVAADTADAAPAEDVVVRPSPGRFVPGTAGLSETFVLKGVWAGVAGRVVAVGNDGIVATQAAPDAPWQVVARGDAAMLNAVHGSDPADLWAVGSGGTLLSGAFDSLSGDAPPGGGPALWDVFGLKRNLAVAVGQDGTILQWDGLGWQRPRSASPDASWNAMSGFGGTLALVGANGAAAIARGASFTTVSTGTTYALHGVHLTSEEDLVAVGDNGVVLVGQGASWRREALGLSEALRDVHGVAGDVWVAGEAGALLRFDGTAWAPLARTLADDLLAVWRAGPDRVLVAGKDGRFAELGVDGVPLAPPETLADNTDLLDLWATAEGDLVVAVGQNGSVFMRREGGTWEAAETGTSQTLDSVWGSSATDIWVAGRAGTVLHYDGAAWTRVVVPSTGALNAVWGDAANRFYIAGAGAQLLVWDGETWSGLSEGTTSNLRAVFLRSVNDGWAVGAQGTVMRFRGLGWAKTPVMLGEEALTDELHAVWAFSATDAWAVGAAGRIIRWDGAAWSVVETPWDVTLRGLYGLAPDDLWAVGNEGQALHWNGEAWSRMETGVIATLHAIHGDGARHVVAVGSLGTVLRLARED
jgi:hypothetical protein